MDKYVLVSTHNLASDIELSDLISVLKDFEKAYAERIEELEETIREQNELIEALKHKEVRRF